MDFRIIRKTPKPFKTEYVIDLTLDEGETLDKQKLLEALDRPFGAPFGGQVHKLPDDTLLIEVYTD